MRKYLTVIIFILQAFAVLAQDGIHRFQKIHISAGIYAEPEKNFSDSTGSYSFRQVFVRASVPVFSKAHISEKFSKHAFTRIAWDAGASAANPYISFLDEQHRLFNLMTGFSGLYFNGSKSLWLGSFHTSVSEDNYSISDPLIRYTGYLIYLRNSGNKFDYQLGAAYSYLFGNAVFLPVLGFRYRFNQEWRMSFTMPFRISLFYKPDRSNHFEFFLAPAGSMTRFSISEPADSSVKKILFLRKQQYQTGIGWRHKISSACVFNFRTGFLTGRKISFMDDQNTIFRSKIHGSVFISAGFTFKFGKSKLSQTDHKETSDELPDEIDIDDIE